MEIKSISNGITLLNEYSIYVSTLILILVLTMFVVDKKALFIFLKSDKLIEY